MTFFKIIKKEKFRISIGKFVKNQSEKIRSNNKYYNKNNLNNKEMNFNQREYTIEDFEKLYANSQWKNNE